MKHNIRMILTILTLFFILVLTTIILLYVGRPNIVYFQINGTSRPFTEMVENYERINTDLNSQLEKERALWTYVISLFATLLAVFGIYSTISRMFEKKEFEEYKTSINKLIDDLAKRQEENGKIVKQVFAETKILQLAREYNAMNADNNLRLFCGVNNSVEVKSFEEFLVYIDEVCDEFRHMTVLDISALKLVITCFALASIHYSVKKMYTKDKSINNPSFDHIHHKMIEHLGSEKASIIYEYTKSNIY